MNKIFAFVFMGVMVVSCIILWCAISLIGIVSAPIDAFKCVRYMFNTFAETTLSQIKQNDK